MSKKLNIGLIYNLTTDRIPLASNTPELIKEFDAPETIYAIEDALCAHGHRVVRIGSGLDLLKKITKLDVDIVFNLAEGYSGRNREAEAPIILDMLNIPFVGSDGLTQSICLDKCLTKKIFRCHDILTPKFICINDIKILEKNINLNFPLIVKPRYEGSAKGIDKSSIVKNFKQLKIRANYIIKRFKQPALVEEFIYGGEFTVAIIGNGNNIEVLPVVQRLVEKNTTLSAHIFENNKGYDYFLASKLTPVLEQNIKNIALSVYNIFACRDFARIDLRLGSNAKLHVLELNPLPSLAKDQTFSLLAEYLGLSYAAMINKILIAALKRYNMI